MRFTDIDVKFDVKYEGHQNCSKIFSMHTFEGFWLPSYVISKLMSICVNLIMSIYFFWTSYIVQVFDFSTTDIFLTTWHHLTFCYPITYVPHYSWEQGWWGIWTMWHVPLLDLHGGRVMGYMGNRAHVQWGTWTYWAGRLGTWVMGTWVIGYIAIIMHRSRLGTGVMGNGAHSGCIQWI